MPCGAASSARLWHVARSVAPSPRALSAAALPTLPAQDAPDFPLRIAARPQVLIAISKMAAPPKQSAHTVAVGIGCLRRVQPPPPRAALGQGRVHRLRRETAAIQNAVLMQYQHAPSRVCPPHRHAFLGFQKVGKRPVTCNVTGPFNGTNASRLRIADFRRVFQTRARLPARRGGSRRARAACCACAGRVPAGSTHRPCPAGGAAAACRVGMGTAGRAHARPGLPRPGAGRALACAAHA